MTEDEKKVLSCIDRDEIIAFMQDIIRARSDYPPGDTRDMAKLCSDKLKSAGIETQILTPPPEVTSIWDDHVDNSTMPSVIGTIKGSGGPLLVLNAHIDTVQAGNLSEWKHDPFAAVIDEDRIYGRGAGDDKGSVLAQIMASVAIARAGIPLKGTLQVNPVADEEATSYRGAKWLRDAGYLKPDMLIVGEQTDNVVACAERAIVYYRVTIKGKASHGAMPWKGNNATVRMAEFINLVHEELIPEVQKIKHPYLPLTTISTTKIEGGIKTNIIPELCTLEIDCRLCPGITEDKILKRFNDLLKKLSDRGPAFGWDVKIIYTEGGIATDTSPESPLIKTMLNAAEEVTGKYTPPTGYNQASDGRVFSASKIPIAIFGPGDPGLGHSPNEFVPINQLVEATKILALTILRLIG